MLARVCVCVSLSALRDIEVNDSFIFGFVGFVCFRDPPVPVDDVDFLFIRRQLRKGRASDMRTRGFLRKANVMLIARLP